jgi:hypothetical protein
MDLSIRFNKWEARAISGYNPAVLDEIKRGLLWGLQLAVMTVAALVILCSMFYVAFHFFSGWRSAAALVGQVGAIVTIVYMWRWSRYPGLVHDKDFFERLRMIVVATFAFTFGVFIYLVAARLHLLDAHELKDWPRMLGLAFNFSRGERAKVSGAAPREIGPGSHVTVLGARVVGEHDFSNEPIIEEPGTVIYQVQYENGVVLEVPERELV